jgi:diphthamide synthase subunit DPH2
MTSNQDERKQADAPALEVVAIADFDSLMWIPPFGHGMNTVRGKLVTIRSAQAAVAALQARLNQQSALVEKCMVAMNENADRGQEAQQRIAELEAALDEAKAKLHLAYLGRSREKYLAALASIDAAMKGGA